MDSNMRTSEVLNRAADLIEGWGWGTGNKAMCVDGPYGFCVEGALGHVQGVRVADVKIFEGEIYDYAAVEDTAAYGVLAEHIGVQYLYPWNDKQESAEPVIEALRAAALIEQVKEERADQDSAFATYAGNLERVA